jgi:hypothetical protein
MRGVNTGINYVATLNIWAGTMLAFEPFSFYSILWVIVYPALILVISVIYDVLFRKFVYGVVSKIKHTFIKRRKK